MLKTLYRQIGQYKWAAVLTPLFTAAEVVMDVLIPWVTASLIDKGINAGDIAQVYRYGGLMLLLALVSLALGRRCTETFSALRSPTSTSTLHRVW